MLTKNPLAAVCAVAFLLGGAAAVVLTRPASDQTTIQEYAGRDGDAGRTAPADASEPARGASEGAPVEEPSASVEREPAPESAAVTAESAPTVVERETRGRAAAGRVDESSKVARGYARVPAGRQSSGGNPLVSYPVGGVKKTGEGVKKAGTTIGKTFGKVGGLFHD